jgi:hypothetical protein
MGGPLNLWLLAYVEGGKFCDYEECVKKKLNICAYMCY